MNSAELGVRTKGPDDTLDYDIDVARRYLPPGDVVVDAAAVVASGTVTIADVTFSEGIVRVWVAAGTAGETSEIDVTVTSAQNRIKKFCIHIRIREC